MGDGTGLRGVDWQLLVMPSGQDFFMEVKGDATWEGSCSRCLEPLDLPLKVESQFLGSKDPDLVVRGAHSLGSQDLDVVFFPETVLDEAALVREQFQLQAPMHPALPGGLRRPLPPVRQELEQGPLRLPAGTAQGTERSGQGPGGPETEPPGRRRRRRRPRSLSVRIPFTPPRPFL